MSAAATATSTSPASREGVERSSATGGIPVVVVSSMSDDRMIASVLRAGAAGFIPKHSQRSVFVEAFAQIRGGGVYTPEGYLEPTDPAGALDRIAGGLTALIDASGDRP